jgi:hypothetical protein
MESWQISLPLTMVSMTFNLTVRKQGKKILLMCNVSLHAALLSHSHLTSLAVNALLYLPWTEFSDNRTRNIGTIAFVLISTHDDLLRPDSVGLGEPVNETLVLAVWSWIADGTRSELQMISLGGSEVLMRSLRRH